MECTGSTVREVPLTRGYVALVDEADWLLVSAFRWCPFFAAGGLVYARSRGRSMHRLILNAQPGQFVDHANRDALDNRRINLRFCTRQQNAANGRQQMRRVSRFRGVSRDQGKWRATIQASGKNCFLGRFLIEEEAARAYDARARELFGEFARLNFPVEAKA